MDTSHYIAYYIKWGFESRLKQTDSSIFKLHNYIKWGFESRLKPASCLIASASNYIKWGFESRLKRSFSFLKPL